MKKSAARRLITNYKNLKLSNSFVSRVLLLEATYAVMQFIAPLSELEFTQI